MIHLFSSTRFRTDTLASVIDEKIQPILQTISALQNTVQEIEKSLKDTHEKIITLENYSHLDNLIVVGLPSADYVESASVGTEKMETENSEFTEKVIVELANTILHVPLTEKDISVAHWLDK